MNLRDIPTLLSYDDMIYICKTFSAQSVKLIDMTISQTNEKIKENNGRILDIKRLYLLKNNSFV